MILVPLLLICALLSPSIYAQESDDAEVKGKIEALMQRAEYHHVALRESLDELTSSLVTLKDRPDLHTSTRHKRDSLAALTSSYFAFCQTLLNASGHSVTKQENADSENSPKNKMITPNSTVTPISVTVEHQKDKNMAIVRFKVKYTKPGFASIFLTKLDIGANKRKRFRVSLFDKLPKTSNVVFRIKTGWCSIVEDPPEIYFYFHSKFPNEIATTVGVDVCGKERKVEGAGSIPASGPGDRSEKEAPIGSLPFVPGFKYNTTSPDFVVEKGKNISVVLEFSEMVIKRMQSHVTDLSMQNTAYNTTTGVSFSSMGIYNSYVNDGSLFEFSERSTRESQLPLNGLVNVDEILAPRRSSLEANSNENGVSNSNQDIAASGGSDNEDTKSRVGFLNITFNSSPGDNSFLSIFMMTNRYDNGIIRYSQIELPFIINRANKKSPFPENLLAPMHETKQACDLNKKSQLYKFNLGYCAVTCSVIGDPISAITISKIEGKKTHGYNQETAISAYWGAAMMKLGQGHPSMSGKYRCQVTSKTGKKTVFEIDYMVASSVVVNRNESQATVQGDSTVMICSAEGTNVQLQITYSYYDDDRKKMIERIDTNPDFEKTVQVAENDRAMFSLTVPNSTYGYFACNASNSYNNDYNFYDMNAVRNLFPYD